MENKNENKNSDIINECDMIYNYIDIFIDGNIFNIIQALKELNISIYDNEGKLKNIDIVLKDVNKALESINIAELKNNIMPKSE